MLVRTRALSILALLLATIAAPAQDAHFAVPLADLALETELPPEWRLARTAFSDRWAESYPRVWIEGGEGYLVPEREDGSALPLLLVARAPANGDVRGSLHLPRLDREELAPVAFTLRAAQADPAARVPFLRGRYVHAEDLRQRGVPGGAWFRHVAEEARRELERLGASAPDLAPRPSSTWISRGDELEDTYALFTGGRALSENLRLDRVVDSGAEAQATVPIAEIEGITVEELDWTALVEGRAPALDPLASLVPADQHALLFPSFGALVALVDEVAEYGAPILQLLEPRSESARVVERYQEQLCLPLDELARALGALAVSRVALTGSDPYFRTGTDLALLFESERPELLEAFVRAQQLLAVEEGDAARVEGELGGLAYEGADSGDWRVSSYMARAGGALVVTNALEQLEAVAAVLGGERPSLASLPEYAFFRDRYPIGDAGESAFLVLTDATIRRWCGPRWRIGASRRLRAGALLAEARAEHLDELVAGEVEARVLRRELGLPGGGALHLTKRGALSDVYGSLEFLTPIARLDLERVTPAEREGYERFRVLYESNWRQFFDPIAARLELSDGRLALDLTVMPLIAGSDYGDLTDLAGDVVLSPRAGDPHEEALLHFLYAIDRESRSFRQLEEGLRILPTSAGSALAWVGESFEVYVDRDSLWDELPEDGDPDAFLNERVYDVPVAVRVAARDPLRLAAFLTALRTFAEQTAPGLLRWESREHMGEPYVAILADEDDSSMFSLEGLGIYYAPGPDALVVSLREDVVRRSIERRKLRPAGIPADALEEKPAPRPWLGGSASFRIERQGIEIVTRLFGDRYRREMQERAWAALPILNEWRRLYPALDPVELHERLWDARLVEPAGGRYVWNDALHTMGSTLYGSPGAPLEGPAVPEVVHRVLSADFGLTFEEDGLRARAALVR